jgi:uncharacterized membrane protein YeaQ/YmgE (transglycosylase-associated protein family)
MTLGGLLLFLLIGLIAGWVAAKLMRGSSLGLVGQLITAIVGSVVLLLVVGVLKRA